MGDAVNPGGYGGQTARPPKIKNKSAAAVQITAEQLIREAYERQGSAPKAPRQKVLDGEELSDYQQRRRRSFEEGVRKNRSNIAEWLRYAAWEESQNEVKRARSLYERALDVDPRNQTVYIKYAELEMKNKNTSLARNLYDRAVTILPRVSQFWYRYAYMEELLGNVAGAREIFDRWMQWEPAEDAWMAYIKFEKRYREPDNARQVFERFAYVHPQPKTWLAWARFEEEEAKGGDHPDRVRDIYGRAIDRLGSAFIDQHVFISFAKYEARLGETERARAIYKYALERLPQSKSQALHNQYTLFEKQHGGRVEIEDVVATTRRTQYATALRLDPRDYDAWIDLTKLEASLPDNADRTRDAYERAVAECPRVADKRVWRRYIYLWLFYALFEETQAKDTDRARQVYLACIDLIPHKQFTFAKLWLQYAWFEVRQGELDAARRALGQALGMCPKDKLFRGYIALELELRCFDRVRTLYSKYVEFNPTNCATWTEFARLEAALGEDERTRALFELAVEQPSLDMPEVLWKAYIDYEYDRQEYENTRALYERLLSITDHVKVWISYARFELSVVSQGVLAARKIYERAYGRLKELRRTEDRLALLEAWRDVEASDESMGNVASVDAKMPRRVRKRRKLDDGSLEEYFDYVFPDDDDADHGARFKLLAKAHLWKLKASKESVASDE